MKQQNRHSYETVTDRQYRTGHTQAVCGIGWDEIGREIDREITLLRKGLHDIG